MLLKHFFLILFCQCPHLCFTQPFSRPQLLCSRWPLRFGGCDRGRPVSVSLRAELWHLTQYPRRIRFLPRSSPSSISVYLSSPWVLGLLQRKPLQAGTPITSDSHCGANMPRPRASLRDHRVPPSLPPLVNSIRVPWSVQVLSVAVMQLHTRLSYATKSVSADLHGTSQVRGTRRHLSLKDVEPGKTGIFPKEGYCH